MTDIYLLYLNKEFFQWSHDQMYLIGMANDIMERHKYEDAEIWRVNPYGRLLSVVWEIHDDN